MTSKSFIDRYKYVTVGDYDTPTTVHSDAYPAIDPSALDLTGRAVFIRGASNGMGRVMTLSFAKAGVSYIAAGAESDRS